MKLLTCNFAVRIYQLQGDNHKAAVWPCLCHSAASMEHAEAAGMSTVGAPVGGDSTSLL